MRNFPRVRSSREKFTGVLGKFNRIQEASQSTSKSRHTIHEVNLKDTDGTKIAASCPEPVPYSRPWLRFNLMLLLMIFGIYTLTTLCLPSKPICSLFLVPSRLVLNA